MLNSIFDLNLAEASLFICGSLAHHACKLQVAGPGHDAGLLLLEYQLEHLADHFLGVCLYQFKCV